MNGRFYDEEMVSETGKYFSNLTGITYYLGHEKYKFSNQVRIIGNFWLFWLKITFIRRNMEL